MIETLDEVVSLFHSIKRLEIAKDGEILIWYHDESEYPDHSDSFITNSFSQKLFSLIEDHFVKE